MTFNNSQGFPTISIRIPKVIHYTWLRLIAGLNNLILNKDERSGKERILANYFVESLHTHNFWAMKMLIIEFLNLLNVVGQIYFVDVFLGGEFRYTSVNTVERLWECHHLLPCKIL